MGRGWRYNTGMKVFNGGCSKGRLIVAGWLVGFFPYIAQADVMVRVEESFNGQLPMTAVHWFGPERSTRDDGSRYVVTRLDEGRIYTVDRLAQTYRITELAINDQAQTSKEVRALKGNEVRKIGPWTARRYEVIGAATAGMKIVIWASRDVDIDLEKFRNIMTALSRRPGSEWMAAYRNIDGFPVLQEVTMDYKGSSFHGQTRVVAVEERAPPDHIYQPPADYERLP